MKKYILIILIALIMCSCSNESQVNSYEPPIDSSKLDSLKRDSLYKPTAHIAYGKIQFGINEKEYHRLMPDVFNRIGKFDYKFTPILNDEGKLYGVYIESLKETANYIDNTLTEKLNNLYEVVSQKYGLPSENFGRPDFFKFKPGRVQWQYQWDVSTKRIYIGMSEIDSGSQYKTVCYIYDYNMEKQQSETEEEKANSEQKASANNF